MQLKFGLAVKSDINTPSPACDDVLQFWQRNDSLGLYPVLCKLAHLHLSASASSVPVECMFCPFAVHPVYRHSVSFQAAHKVNYIFLGSV